VIPSLYEAGSFPLIEAMQIGAPVVCARTTSLPGTIGDDRFVFDPRNRESMVDKVLSLVGDRAFREDNRLNSQKRAEWMQEVELGAEYEKLWQSTLERTVRR
jgi:glycosyltransferase involved in cell wall biosynthesis